MADFQDQLKALIQLPGLTGKELKESLRQLVRDTWPDLPPWSTLDGPIIEEVQKATVGCGVVVTSAEAGVRKVVLAEAGDHYRRPEGTGPAFMIPGGFINLSETPGSALVPASTAPEDGRTGAAREVEEEFRKSDRAPLLRIEPSRLVPMDTRTLAFPSGEKRVVIGFMLELDAQEVATVQEHVTKLGADGAYRTATMARSINPDSGRPEVSNVVIVALHDVVQGRCQLLHRDQLSLFQVIQSKLA